MVETTTWQELMDKAYDEWKKHPGLSYEEFLAGLDAKEEQAVLLGNLNYQVQNGGFDQWVFNGYASRGPEVVVLLELMQSPVAFELARRLPGLLDFVKPGKKSRGCFGDYWIDDDDVPTELMEELTDWFYGVNERFEEEVENFLSE